MLETGNMDSEKPPGNDDEDVKTSGQLDTAPTSLQPFVHQVGGHSNMFTYEGNTVCKPLFEKEYEFYRTMPRALRPFAPVCKGNFDVMFCRDANEQVRISIMSPVRPFIWQNEVVTASKGIGTTSNGVISNQLSHGHVDHHSERSTVISKTNLEKNPWAERCHNRMLDQMKSGSDQLASRKYIILENAVINFKMPSILDLKMGTRQHGLDDNEFKTDLKIARCLSSTSCTHGFRVGGMQIYQKDTGDFFRFNKYSAAAINRDNIHESFHRFLFNGVRLRLELIDPIVQQIRAILLAVMESSDIRLYASSLMVIYESEEAESVEEDTRGVGAAGCQVQGQKCANGSASNGIDFSKDSPPESSVHVANCKQTSSKTNSVSPKINIKLIDFAHSFHTDSIKDVNFVGPDVGYIFGLQSVIKIFLDIKERYSAS